MRLGRTSALLHLLVLVVPKHCCDLTLVNKAAGNPIAWTAAWRSTFKACACINSHKGGVPSVALWVVVARAMAAPSDSVLHTRFKNALHCWQLHDMSRFTSLLSLFFLSRCLNNYAIFLLSHHLNRWCP